MVFIAILLIGTVYVFISTITDTINSDLNEIEENKKEIVEDKENNETEVVEEKTTVQECLADLGYNEFIFLHSPSCGHCRTMMPIVEELIAQGYDIQIVNAIENSNFAKISNCISGMKGSVPQFICNKNGIPKIGSMTKEKLIEVYNSC